MRKGRTALVYTLAMLLTLVLLTGCQAQPAAQPTQAPSTEPTDNAQPAPTDEPQAGKAKEDFTGTVQYWTKDTSWADAMQEPFAAAYPNIEVNYTPIEWFDYLQKLTTTIASGTQMPDVICATVEWRMRVFEMGVSENLEAEPYNLDRNDMFEYLWPRCEDPDGHIVGLEMQLTPSGLGYRKDIAQEVWGVKEREDLEKLFKDAGDNYDAYVTLGKQILEKTDGKVKMFAGLGDIYAMVYAQDDTPLINEDGSINLTERVLPTLEVVKKFKDAGIVSTYDQWTPQWEASYASGEVFCYPWTTWTTGSVRDTRDPDGAGHWGLMIPPYGAFSWGGTTMGVCKDSQNKEATWEYVRWCNWDLEGAKVAADKKDYQVSRISNYEKEPSLSSKYDDYYEMDLFKFWAEDAVDSAIAVTPTVYDQIVMDAIHVSLTALQANPDMTAQDMMDMVKTEVSNKVDAGIIVH